MTTDSVQPTKDELLADLHRLPLFAGLSRDKLECLSTARVEEFEVGATMAEQGEFTQSFWIVLDGAVGGFRDETVAPLATHERGSMFGELSLLASVANPVSLRVVRRARVLRMNEDVFWQLMSICPEVRRVILENLAMRIKKLQSMTIQQEKMASLGTMAAGLMHELNNPGAAVKRAAAQLREVFLATQQRKGAAVWRTLSPNEQVCLDGLKQQIMRYAPNVPVSPLALSDAEDAMTEWLENAGVEDGWRIAPTLASMGVSPDDLACARETFSPETFAETVRWFESFSSCLKLVWVIEEGIGRVTELVQAVKSYAHESRGQMHQVNVNKSIEATLLLLGHKLRAKGIHLEKELAAELPELRSSAIGLNQIWTNLLDNAIDAVGPEGHIAVATWSEACTSDPGKQMVCVKVKDDGAGIEQECQAHIFDAFYTTKPAGVGTGLGLNIVGRVVEQSGGTMLFSSAPGETEFLVRLPVEP